MPTLFYTNKPTTPQLFKSCYFKNAPLKRKS